MKLPQLLGVLALALSSGAARADRLIWIPTASIAHLQADYTQEAFGKAGVVTGQIGLGKQFELMVRHYKDFGPSDKTEVGGQYQVLPEGIATPALSIGVWDVADDGRGETSIRIAKTDEKADVAGGGYGNKPNFAGRDKAKVGRDERHKRQ